MRVKGSSYSQMTFFDKPTDASILSYPGSKASIRKEVVRDLIALGVRKHGLCSPFMGGGSVELYAAAQQIKVYASDAFQLLVNFWTVAKKTPGKLSCKVLDILGTIDYNTVIDGEPQTQECIEELRKVAEYCFTAHTPLERAAYFYIRNKTSYSGTMFKNNNVDKGTFDRSLCVLGYKREISDAMIDRLATFNTPAVISCADYRVEIKNHPNCIFYCDPPYAGIKHKFYGISGSTQEGLNHHEFYECMTEKRRRFIVSYDNHPMIRRLWGRYYIKECNWTYQMTADDRRKTEHARELLIYSDDPEDF